VSNAFALAGVTAVLSELLRDGIVNHNINSVIGTTVGVSALPPDRVVPANGSEHAQINLFLHQVTPNKGWCNEGLPSRDVDGRTRLSNRPLALNLHYLLSAYSGADLQGEILLGFAMQVLHEVPVLTRDAIRTALATLSPPLNTLADSGLDRQIEQIRIVPEYLNTEEMSKLWTATLSHLRPTAAYQASVVLIEATQPAVSPLPVLSRQIRVRPELLPAVPTIDAVVPDAKQPVVLLGTTITLKGHHLDGTGREVILVNDRFKIEEPFLNPAGDATSMQFLIPVARAADFPVGVYQVTARVQQPGDIASRESNSLAMTVAPQISGLPMDVHRDAGGTASFTIQVVPALRAGQAVSLVLGRQEFAPQPFTAPASALNFVIPDAPVANHLARLRIDGIDSPIIDPAAVPPKFLDQRINMQ
jgi:hypothetical protein